MASVESTPIMSSTPAGGAGGAGGAVSPAIDEAERQAQLDYWKHHTALEPTVETMMLDSQASLIDEVERPEILSLVPTFDHLKDGPRMVELGAGIGRFTPEFAARSASVVAVDFIEELITANEKANSHLPNVTFRCADATKLELPSASFDLVFSNWLLMYLGDSEVQQLGANALRWLAPQGYYFFRESCFRPSGDRKRTGHNPTHYRDPRWYNKVTAALRVIDEDGEEYGLRLVRSSAVQAYIKLKDNENQVYFLWQKVPVAELPDPSTRAAVAAADAAADADATTPGTIATAEPAVSPESPPRASGSSA